MQKQIRSVVIALLILSSVGSASAMVLGGTVIGGSALAAGGTFVKLTAPLSNPFGPPNSVGDDNFQSPNLYAFDEEQYGILGSALATDVGIDPLPLGTVLASHYCFFDPGPSKSMIGTIDFDSPVLAIITSLGNLTLSDFLGDPTVNYLNPALRGLEAGDAVTISGPNQVLFDVTASTPGDYVRVLTAQPAVPEPGTLALLDLGMIGILAYRRRSD